MNPCELVKGKTYKYCAPYGKSIELLKCIDFSVSGIQYNVVFEVLTDPCNANRIGVIERFNHIEIERYIEEIN